jgi:hypothetical protein
MRTRWRVTTTAAAVVVSGLLTLTWVPPPAVAQVAGVQKEAARQNYKEAERQLKAGNYGGALELYRLADKIAPNPAPKYKIALCHDRLGQSTEAIAAYQIFLDSNPPPDKLGEQIAEARARLAALRAQVKPVQTDVPVQQARPVAPPPVAPPPVAPPPIVLRPQTVAPPPPVGSSEVVYVRRRSNVPAYVLFGLTGVGIGFTAAFGALALQDKSAFNKNPTTSGANKEQLDARVSDAALGAAIVFGVAGTVLVVTNPARPVQVGSVQGFFTPYAGPGAAGAVGGLKF